MKRSPLTRSTPLRRSALSLADRVTRKRQRGLPQADRARVLDRDLWTCQGCGAGPGQVRERGLRLEIQHRLPKGRGGTHDLANLLVLCGLGNAAGCHRRVDTDRAWSYAHGLTLRTGSDPRTEPVTDWRGDRWRLSPDGTKRPLERAA